MTLKTRTLLRKRGFFAIWPQHHQALSFQHPHLRPARLTLSVPSYSSMNQSLMIVGSKLKPVFTQARISNNGGFRSALLFTLDAGFSARQPAILNGSGVWSGI
jgi:hypothetical protein